MTFKEGIFLSSFHILIEQKFTTSKYLEKLLSKAEIVRMNANNLFSEVKKWGTSLSMPHGRKEEHRGFNFRFASLKRSYEALNNKLREVYNEYENSDVSEEKQGVIKRIEKILNFTNSDIQKIEVLRKKRR